MSQFESEVPGPLRHNKPAFLAPGGMRAPAVRLLFLVFIREHGLKRATMEIQSHHISRGERAWRQGGGEQLVDTLPTRGPDFYRGIWSFPCGNDDPCAWSCWRKQEIRKVKEGPTGSCFRMGDLLIRRLSQASLHLREVEEIIILAPHDGGESSQVGDNRAVAILAVQPDHGLAQRKRLSFHIPTECPHRLPQFSSILAVARARCPRKRADPLMRMRLEYGCPSADGFTPLASEIPWSTHLVQTALGRGKIRSGWQGTLADRLPCAIHVEDEPVISLSIP